LAKTQLGTAVPRIILKYFEMLPILFQWQVKCLECTLVYVLNGEVVHETLEQPLGGPLVACSDVVSTEAPRFPRTKQIHDHDYIARLLRFELEKVGNKRRTQLNDARHVETVI
jgi:hypothetical protein